MTHNSIAAFPQTNLSSVTFPETPKHCVWFFGFCETPKHSVWFFGFCRPVCKGMRHWKYRLIIIVVIPQTRAHSTTRTKHSVFGNVWCFGFCAFQRSVVSHMNESCHTWMIYVCDMIHIASVTSVYRDVKSCSSWLVYAVRDSYCTLLFFIGGTDPYCKCHKFLLGFQDMQFVTRIRSSWLMLYTSVFIGGADQYGKCHKCLQGW